MYFQVAFYEGRWSLIKGWGILETIPRRFTPPDVLKALVVDAAAMALFCAASVLLLRIARRIFKRHEFSPLPFHGAVYLGAILFLYGGVIINVVLMPVKFGMKGLGYTALWAVTVFLVWLLIYRHLRRRQAAGDERFAFWSLALALMVCLFGILPWLDYHTSLAWRLPKAYMARIGIFVGFVFLQQAILTVRAWAVAALRKAPKAPGRKRLWAMRIVAASTVAAAAVFAGASGKHEPLDTDLVTSPGHGLPNILMISMDTARADALSCYSKRGHTPFLDKLASGGVLFEDARSPSPWTLPGHSSMFTARYPSAHGATWEFTYLLDNETTIAEILKAAGYRTAGFSSNVWVSPFTNLDQGFDYFYILGTQFELDRKARERPLLLWEAIARPLLRRLHNRGWLPSPEPPFIKNKSRQVNRMIERYLEKNKSSRRPFFIFVNYVDPHNPYRPLAQFKPEPPDGADMEKIGIANKNPATLMAGRVSLNDKEKEYLFSLYYAAVTSLDLYIRELFEFLEKTKFTRNAIVIVTADHGEYLGEHDQYYHLFGVHEPVIRVPLIIYAPGRIPGGKRLRGMAQTVDIPPTLLDLLGVEFKNSSRFQGKTLLPLIGNQARVRDYSVSELMMPTLPLKIFARLRGPVEKYKKWKTRQRSITDESYQLEVHQNGYRKLWKLPDDISSVEEIDVTGENPGIADEMGENLKKWSRSFEHADTSGMERPRMSDDFKKQLRALGYLE